MTGDFGVIEIRYDGKETDDHHIDLGDFGISCMGFDKIIRTTTHFAIDGKYVSRKPAQNFRVMLSHTEKNCWLVGVDIYSLVTKELFTSMMSGAITNIPTFVLAYLALRKSDVSRISKDYEEQLIAQGVKVDALEKQMESMVRMSRHLRSAARNAVEPIGISCDTITTSPGTPHAVVFTAADKEIINAKEEAVLSDEAEFLVEISEIDVRNETCKVRFEHEPFEVRHKAMIYDPVIKLRENAYTGSIYHQELLHIRAQLLTEGDELKCVMITHVSDP